MAATLDRNICKAGSNQILKPVLIFKSTAGKRCIDRAFGKLQICNAMTGRWLAAVTEKLDEYVGDIGAALRSRGDGYVGQVLLAGVR